MDDLERLIDATRKLRDLGATATKICATTGGETLVEASFAPVVPAEEPSPEPTDEDLAAAREKILLHSAG